MRVLYLTTGRSIHDYRFLAKLAEKNYEVYYLSLTNEVKKYEIDGIKSFFLECNCTSEMSFFNKMLFGFWEYIRAYKRFRNILNDLKPDILHAGWIYSTGLMAAVSRYKPFLLMPWGSDILILPNKSVFFKKLSQYVIKRADMVTCDAQIVKQKIIKLANYPEERIIVFPWGIDLSLFCYSEELRISTRKELGWEDKKIVIMDRYFEPIYGIEYFLNALPKVVNEIPEVRILLIGSGSLEKNFRKKINDLNISKNVIFLGKIPNQELPKYLNASDLYVSSSLSDGSSLSLLEAMACALPVVVTDVPAIL